MIDATSTVGMTDLMATVRKITQDENSMMTGGVSQTSGISAAAGVTGTAETSDTKAPSFGDMLSGLIKSVDTKNKVAMTDASNLMTGKTNNVHQAMLSMQEAGVAFTMMSEVRNKLVSGYQELMRMQA